MYRFALFLSLAIGIAAAPAAPGQDGQPAPPSTPAARASPKQVYCPVTTTEEIDPEIFTDYKGVRVYFCCNRCKVRFTKDPEQYALKLAAFSPVLDSHPLDKDQPETPHEHDHSDAAIGARA